MEKEERDIRAEAEGQKEPETQNCRLGSLEEFQRAIGLEGPNVSDT